MAYKGACMCRSIEFSFTGRPRFVKECVCESCRIAHGASAVGWVGVKTSQFNLDLGESLLCWYRSSADSERGYCSDCGTRILFRSSKWPNEIHMALACMSTPHDLTSTGLSFAKEMPAWTVLSAQKDT